VAESEQRGSPSDERLERAIEALLDRERYRAAEERVTRVAPQLQKVLAGALSEGGWFDSSHAEQLAKATAIADPDERLAALRTLLAEEARLAMLVGVAVGWELALELDAGSGAGRGG
jgi:hypothetical protein